LSALHELVALVAVIELVVVVVPPAFVELVTVAALLALLELVTFVELLASIVLVAAADTTFSAEPHAHSPSATTITRYLIVKCSNLVDPVCYICVDREHLLRFSFSIHNPTRELQPGVRPEHGLQCHFACTLRP